MILELEGAINISSQNYNPVVGDSGEDSLRERVLQRLLARPKEAIDVRVHRRIVHISLRRPHSLDQLLITQPQGLKWPRCHDVDKLGGGNGEMLTASLKFFILKWGAGLISVTGLEMGQHVGDRNGLPSAVFLKALLSS